jgi:hypothetical protein
VTVRDALSAARFTLWATITQALAVAAALATVLWEMVTGDD